MNIDAWRILLEGARVYDDGSHIVPLKYGEAGAVEVETGIFLYGLVRRMQPDVIVETGTSRGWSSACMALAMQDNGHGHVYTLDVEEYSGEKYDLRERLSLDDHLTFIQCDSRAWQPPDNIDVLFLDSDHTLPFVLKEWQHFAPHLNRRGAVVLIHDTMFARGCLRAASMRIAEDARAMHDHVGTVFFNSWRGLDIVQIGEL